MDPKTRAEKVARLKKLERLHALEIQQAKVSDSQPIQNRASKVWEGAKEAGSMYLKGMALPQKLLSNALAKVSGGKGDTPSQVLNSKGVDKVWNPAGPLAGGSYTPGGASLATTPGPAADMLLDMSTDPMMAVGAGVSALAKAKNAGKVIKGVNAVVNPIEALSDARASAAYKKAFFDVDRAATLNNKTQMPSEIMREENFFGGAKSAENKMVELQHEAGQALGAIREEATNKGVTGNFWSQVSPRARDEAEQLRNLLDEKYSNVADNIESRLDFTGERTPPHGEIPFVELGERQTALDKRVVKGSGFGNGLEAADETLVNEALANAYRETQERALQTHAPELLPDFKKQKERYSNLSPLITDTQESVASRVAERRNPLEPTQVDLMLGGTGLAAGSPGALGALIAKKGGHLIFNSTAGRTARGFAYDKVSKAAANGLMDEYLRQKLNPWGSSKASGDE